MIMSRGKWVIVGVSALGGLIVSWIIKPVFGPILANLISPPPDSKA